MRCLLHPFLLSSLLLSALLLAPPTVEAWAGEGLWDRKALSKSDYEKHMSEADDFAEAAVSARKRSGGKYRISVGTVSSRQASYQLATRLARKALESYEQASGARPSSAEPHYRAGEVLLAFMLDGNISPPSSLDRAIEHWRKFEAKAPLDPRLITVLDARSISLTKRGGKKNLRAAVADYDHQLDLIDQSNDTRRVSIARLLSNQAELYMMLGDLKMAIAGYERALEFYVDTVYGYGLAVALDRDKQGQRARATAKLYAESDASNALSRDGTFFVPPGERYYYVAMRAEGRRDYRAAVAAYKKFVRLLPGSPWASQALANIKQLKAKAAKQPKMKVKVKRSSFRSPW